MENHTPSKPKLANLETDEIHHYMGSLVEQNNVPAYQHVAALRRRRGQAAFQIYGNRLQPFLKAWWERAATHQLFFQSRRQTVFLGESRREIVLMLVIPPARSLAVAVFVVVIFLVVLCAMFVVTLSMSVSITLCHHAIACEHEDSNCKGKDPFRRAHGSLRSEWCGANSSNRPKSLFEEP
jgi:hypothetical protein